MNILVTGGAGFIGSNFILYWLANYPNDKIVNLDKLTYAGNLANLRKVEHYENYKFLRGDIGDFENNKRVLEAEKIDLIINFAAESDNNRAVINPSIFTKTNVLGTQALLEAAREVTVKRFHHISTCEVFGEMGLYKKRAFKETDPFLPRTPYNASKAAANHLVMAYYQTFGLPVTISHCCNNFGPRQFPQTIIPLFAINLLHGKKSLFLKVVRTKESGFL